jgi:hypothetical protein
MTSNQISLGNKSPLLSGKSIKSISLDRFQLFKNYSNHINADCAIGNTPIERDRKILQSLQIHPIPFTAAKKLITFHHYLHSFPGGTKLHFGVFLKELLVGAIIFGVGPYLGYAIVSGAEPSDIITLTRFWLLDELPRNSESKVLGTTLKALKRETTLKFILAYSDQSAGHVGTIYQSTNWVYTGLSSATPLYDIGDGILHHSRSLAHRLGTHSIRYLSSQGIDVKTVPQFPKHRYVYFLDESYCSRLMVPVLPYPKKGAI